MKDETGFYPKDSSHHSSPVAKKVLAIRAAYPDMTYAVIGWNVGVTRQRVEQILKKHRKKKTKEVSNG